MRGPTLAHPSRASQPSIGRGVVARAGRGDEVDLLPLPVKADGGAAGLAPPLVADAVRAGEEAADGGVAVRAGAADELRAAEVQELQRRRRDLVREPEGAGHDYVAHQAEAEAADGADGDLHLAVQQGEQHLRTHSAAQDTYMDDKS